MSKCGSLSWTLDGVAVCDQFYPVTVILIKNTIAGVACLVGMITNVGAFIGGDAPAHMAEELKSASKLLPRAMFWTIMVNGALGFIMLM